MNDSESESGSDPSRSSECEEGEQPPSPVVNAPTVEFHDATEELDAKAINWLQSSALEVVRLLGEDGHAIDRVSVRLIADPEMAEAHVSFSNVEGTTDVLAFVGSLDPLEVDILACVDEAMRRAGDFAHDFLHELILYVVHALLHGLGYDDGDHDSSLRMHAEEDSLLLRAGVGAVFRPSGDGGSIG
jgi:probable rRNA maturation factor